MPLFQRGSQGPEVVKLQTRLQALQLYGGPTDGDFGGGTESAVKAFQKQKGLEVDGRVGAITWGALFAGAPIDEPLIAKAPLDQRCLALTGSFETGQPPPECFAGLSGDFDGQGISLGVCQWNFGQASLQPLLTRMDLTHPTIVDDVFHDHAEQLRALLRTTRVEQMNWAHSIQDGQHRIAEPWRGLFKSLCRTTEFQEIQAQFAGRLLNAARELCAVFRVRSQRALALLFDIKVQNGSISDIVKTQIAKDFAALAPSGDPESDEVARLRIIAQRRAAAASPQWVADVMNRKVTIANGVGTVQRSITSTAVVWAWCSRLGTNNRSGHAGTHSICLSPLFGTSSGQTKRLRLMVGATQRYWLAARWSTPTGRIHVPRLASIRATPASAVKCRFEHGSSIWVGGARLRRWVRPILRPTSVTTGKSVRRK